MKNSVLNIRLSNGFVWKVQSTAQTAEWLREMAGFLGASVGRENSHADLWVERAEFGVGQRFDPLTALDLSYHGVACTGQWSIRAWSNLALVSHEELPYVIGGVGEVKDREGRIEQMRLAMLPLYEKVAMAGGLPLHAALVQIRGQGIILAGISGAGKSTCCLRLPLPWRTLGDDMAIVVPCDDGTFRGHALPTWSAVKAQTVERPCVIRNSVPVRAIFFLSHSDVENAEPISGARAALSIYSAAMQVFSSVDHSANIPGGAMYKRVLFENAAAMTAAVPVFVLRVSLQGRFWEKIEEVLGQENEKGDMLLYRIINAHERIGGGLPFRDKG